MTTKRHDGFTARRYDDTAHHGSRRVWFNGSDLWNKIRLSYNLPDDAQASQATLDDEEKAEMAPAGWTRQFWYVLIGPVTLFVSVNDDLTACETEVCDLSQTWHGECLGVGMHNAR